MSESASNKNSWWFGRYFLAVVSFALVALVASGQFNDRDLKTCCWHINGSGCHPASRSCQSNLCTASPWLYGWNILMGLRLKFHDSQMLYVWHIYLHLGHLWGKCWQISQHHGAYGIVIGMSSWSANIWWLQSSFWNSSWRLLGVWGDCNPTRLAHNGVNLFLCQRNGKWTIYRWSSY